jgi:two-component system response regulator MprA
VPCAAQRAQPGADPDADGAHRDQRPGGGARCRRRRLPRQAVRSGRVVGAHASLVAAQPAGCRRRRLELRIETAGRRVTRDGSDIELSKTEYELLELLVRNANVVLDHSTIYDRIWHYDFGPDSKNLAVYIGYLRRKTEERRSARLIHTVRGVGYVARVET